MSIEGYSVFRMSKVCSSLTGCRKDTIKFDCYKDNLLCSGSKRCCNDCHKLYELKGSAKLNATDTIKFQDSLLLPITVSASGATIVLLLQIILLTLMHNSDVKSQRVNNAMQNRILIGIRCLIFVLITFVSMSSFLYSICYIFGNINMLLKCQPTFILLVSWSWILFLWLMELFVDCRPFVSSWIKYDEVTQLKCGWCIPWVKMLSCILKPLTLILSCLRILCFLWWFSIPIYLLIVTHKNFIFNKL